MHDYSTIFFAVCQDRNGFLFRFVNFAQTQTIFCSRATSKRLPYLCRPGYRSASTGSPAVLICGQSSDATERKGELHGLGHIGNILRVDIGTPAVIAANAHLLTHSTNDRVMDRGQLVSCTLLRGWSAGYRDKSPQRCRLPPRRWGSGGWCRREQTGSPYRCPWR